MPLDLRQDEIFSAQLELLIKILAHQKGVLSLLCDKYGATEDESDKLYAEVIEECNAYGLEILKDLQERRGHIDLDDILKS